MIELGSIERDEKLLTPTRNDGLKDPARFRRPTLVAFVIMLPAILLILFEMARVPNYTELPFRLEWAIASVLGLVAWVATYMLGERTSRRLREAVDHVVENARITVRPSQSLTLVGGQHRVNTGDERTVTCVRVEDSVVHQHKTLRAEYDDGSSAVLLADLTTEELEEVCARARAHDIEIV